MLLWLEKSFFVLILFLSTNALLPLLRQRTSMGSGADGDPLQQALWALIYLVACFIFIAHWRNVAAALRREKWLVGLALLALLSVFWSPVPGLTARRSIALIGTTVVGVLLAVRFSTIDIMRLIAYAIATTAGLSIVFALALPTYGIATGIHEGAWQGVFVHKNHLGRMMAVGGLVFFLLAAERRDQWRWRFAIVVAVVLLLLSQSTTAVVVFALAIAIFLLLRNLGTDFRIVVACVIIIGVLTGGLVYWLTQNYQTVLLAMGKDATLTGRTILWAVVSNAILERPWLGYGYDGYWVGWRGPSSYAWQMVGWMPSHAHNGYLDTALSLGVVGLIAFMIGVGRVFFRSLRAALIARKPNATWPLLFLIFYFVYNSVESLIIQRNDLFWIVCVAVVLKREWEARIEPPETEQEFVGATNVIVPARQ